MMLAIVLTWPWQRPEPDFALASKSPDGKRWIVLEWNGGTGPVSVSEVWPGGHRVRRARFTVNSAASLWGAWTPESDGFSLLICAYKDPPSITRLSVGDPTQHNSKTPDFTEGENRMATAIKTMDPERAGTTNADAFSWACSGGNKPFYDRYVRSRTSAQVPFETQRGQRVVLWP
jgi:hypothetical protein